MRGSLSSLQTTTAPKLQTEPLSLLKHTAQSLALCRSREDFGREPSVVTLVQALGNWIPAYAGMTPCYCYRLSKITRIVRRNALRPTTQKSKWF